eukprot:3450936-Alexandrium_andersonii.AAC.1
MPSTRRQSIRRAADDGNKKPPTPSLREAAASTADQAGQQSIRPTAGSGTKQPPMPAVGSSGKARRQGIRRHSKPPMPRPVRPAAESSAKQPPTPAVRPPEQ